MADVNQLLLKNKEDKKSAGQQEIPHAKFIMRVNNASPPVDTNPAPEWDYKRHPGGKMVLPFGAASKLAQ